jgi:hypothetical protein
MFSICAKGSCLFNLASDLQAAKGVGIQAACCEIFYPSADDK